MRKKDIVGDQWLGGAFRFTSAMKRVSRDPECYAAIQVFLPGTRELRVRDSGEVQSLSGEGYKWVTWLPMDESWALIVFFTPEDEIIRWYFDISRRNYIDDAGMPCRDDLYLDLIVLTDGRTITKDVDELQAAFERGDVSAEDYAHAYGVRDWILSHEWSDVGFLTGLSRRLLAVMAA